MKERLLGVVLTASLWCLVAVAPASTQEWPKEPTIPPLRTPEASEKEINKKGDWPTEPKVPTLRAPAGLEKKMEKKAGKKIEKEEEKEDKKTE